MSKKVDAKQKTDANKDTKNSPGSPKTDTKKGDKVNKANTGDKTPDHGQSKQKDDIKLKEEQELIQLRLNQVNIYLKKANNFEKYVNDTGLALAFQLIFSELISNHIQPEKYFTYTAMRLKEIGKEIEGVKSKYAK